MHQTTPVRRQAAARAAMSMLGRSTRVCVAIAVARDRGVTVQLDSQLEVVLG
jgi:hypothetical protein